MSTQKRNRKQNSLSQQGFRPLRPSIQLDRSREASNSIAPRLLVIRASNTIDLFNTLPVDEGWNTHCLISKCKLLVGYSLLSFTIDNNTNNRVVHIMLFPPNPNRPYSPIKPNFREEETQKELFSNSALLHSCLGSLAITVSSLPNSQLGHEVAYHFGQAIAIINKSIGNFQYESATKKDKTICAVAVITHFEVRALSTSASIYNS
jgi:hypothetical protein